MAQSTFCNEISNKMDCRQSDDINDAVAAKPSASGFSPPWSTETEIKALRSANCELQARLSGYLVLPQMMEKKAKECKLWKLRACKAERELKLMMNILQPSQLEELQKQNVCDESLSLSNYTSADSSLESCYHTSLGKPHDSGSHVVYVPELKEQRRCDTAESRSDSQSIDTDDVNLLKQQIATYIEDFENERKDRERLVAICDQQKRDLQILHTEKKSIFQQARQFEDELHLLRQDNAAMKAKEADYTRSCNTGVAAPYCRELPRTGDDWTCFSCMYKNNQLAAFCERCGYQQRRKMRLSLDNSA